MQNKAKKALAKTAKKRIENSAVQQIENTTEQKIKNQVKPKTRMGPNRKHTYIKTKAKYTIKRKEETLKNIETDRKQSQIEIESRAQERTENKDKRTSEITTWNMKNRAKQKEENRAKQTTDNRANQAIENRPKYKTETEAKQEIEPNWKKT